MPAALVQFSLRLHVGKREYYTIYTVRKGHNTGRENSSVFFCLGIDFLVNMLQ